MDLTWETKSVETMPEALDVLDELQGKHWICRGHSCVQGVLVPSIDRPPRQELPRIEKLRLERESIDLFRASARAFASPGEAGSLVDPFICMAVLRHYDVPTRVLDWTRSPFVAALFAASQDTVDGELWAFDERAYELEGKAQWVTWPETTTDGSGHAPMFDGKLTAFTVPEPPEWIVVMSYPAGFPRQEAQRGAYTVMARFGVDHAAAIARVLSGDRSRYRRYVVRSCVKAELRRVLRDRHGLWRGSLFPDSAGAAKSAESVFTDGSAGA
jgi:hypothetical protein